VRIDAWSAWFGKGSAVSTLLLWLVFALTLFQLSLVLGWLPTLVVDKGFAPSDGSMAQLLFNVGTILGAGVISLLCDRIGVRSTMVAVYIGMAIVIYMLSQAREIGPVLALSLAGGFFILGVQFALYGIAPKLYDEAIRGVGVGGAVGVGRIGAIVGPIVAGMLLGSGLSGDGVLQMTAPVSLAAGFVFLLLTFAAPHRLLKTAEAGARARSGAAVQESGGAG
jgi:AAHS family 3-hydroxyphenylpropionic acid transporter